MVHKTVSILLIFLCISLIAAPLTSFLAEAKSKKFSVWISMCCANADSPTVKVSVKLDNGDKQTKKFNLAKEIFKQDEPEVGLKFTFKHSPKTFTACVDKDCKPKLKNDHTNGQTIYFCLKGSENTTWCDKYETR
jgi:hypothetical protein